jgi:hypothetical protein
VDIPGQLHVAYSSGLGSIFLAAGTGTDTINVNATTIGLPVMIEPSVGSDSVNVDSPGTGTAVAEFVASQQIGALTIGNGGQAIVPTGITKVLQASSVATFGSGTLDLTTNDLDVSGSTLNAVNSLVAMGYNAAAGGSWSGPGITSSSAAADSTHLTALGVIQNNQSGTAIFTPANNFDGSMPGPGDVLVKFTYTGDVTLDGKVDGTDYSRIDNGALNNLTGWFNGDLNYDGVIDGSDYTLMDNAYNTQGPSLEAQIASAASAGKTNPLAARSASFFSQSQISLQPVNSTLGWGTPPDNIAAEIFATDPDQLRSKLKKRMA